MIHWIIAESKYVSRVHRHSHPRNSNDLEKVSPLASSLSKPITPLCMKWSYWSKFKFIKPHWPNLSFGKSNLIGCLIQVSRPQLTLNEHFGGRSQALLLKELCPPKWQKSRISLKNRVVKLLPTWQLMDVLSRPKLLNALTALTPPAGFPS